MTEQRIEIQAQAVGWDLDGTLLDSFGLYRDTLAEVLQARGMPVPPHQDFARNYHGPLRDSIGNVCGIGGRVLDALYDDFIACEERHYEHPEGLYFTDALDLLARTAIPQVLLSNRPHHNDARLGSPRNLAKRAPLAGRLRLVVCGDDSPVKKPDPAALDLPEQALGIPRSEWAFVGDQFVDAMQAHNAGASAVLVARDEEATPHLDRLPDGWQERIHVVTDLRNVTFVPGVPA